jgi:hypothetical protein
MQQGIVAPRFLIGHDRNVDRHFSRRPGSIAYSDVLRQVSRRSPSPWLSSENHDRSTFTGLIYPALIPAGWDRQPFMDNPSSGRNTGTDAAPPIVNSAHCVAPNIPDPAVEGPSPDRKAFTWTPCSRPPVGCLPDQAPSRRTEDHTRQAGRLDDSGRDCCPDARIECIRALSMFPSPARSIPLRASDARSPGLVQG